MAGTIVLCGLIVYLKFSGLLLRLFNLRQSFAIAIAYSLFGFAVAGILLFYQFQHAKKGALILLLLYAAGLITQVFFWYYKDPKVKAGKA